MNSQSGGSLLIIRRIAVALLLAAPGWTFAQSESDLINFLEAGKNDASKLMGAYLNPMVEGLSYSFNGGWYHTAKAHNTLGFDLGVSANAVFLPKSKNYFTPSALGLQNTVLIDPTTGKAPTVVGPDETTTYQSSLDTNGDGIADENFTFSGPEGLDFKETFKVSGVLAPTVQLGIGIIKNTDL